MMINSIRGFTLDIRIFEERAVWTANPGANNSLFGGEIGVSKGGC